MADSIYLGRGIVLEDLLMMLVMGHIWFKRIYFDFLQHVSHIT